MFVAEVRGSCDSRFEAVRAALAESLDGEDVGASAAVFVDGEPVADLWGGHTDAARTTAWERDTITNVWSTTKTMVALTALILADRSDIDLDAPVARYWPEFAAAGKACVLVRHVLSHTAGLPDFDPPLAPRDLLDWKRPTERLAAQAPAWEPGMLAGYHSVTQGFLIGEVVRRVTGQTLAAFFAEHIAGPLGADFHITLTAEHDHRFAPGIAPPSALNGDLIAKAPDAKHAPANGLRLSDGNSVAWRRAEIPSASGYGNARSVAAVQSVLACGGTARGVRLLSGQGCEPARREQYRGIDHVIGSSARYGMGYGIFDSDRSVGWGGWGGSTVFVDLQSRMAVAYVMNQMLTEGGGGYHRALAIVMAAYEGITRA
jgi:CubicO group peptidase (beta-lactamase class C family)